MALEWLLYVSRFVKHVFSRIIKKLLHLVLCLVFFVSNMGFNVEPTGVRMRVKTVPRHEFTSKIPKEGQQRRPWLQIKCPNGDVLSFFVVSLPSWPFYPGDGAG